MMNATKTVEVLFYLGPSQANIFLPFRIRRQFRVTIELKQSYSTFPLLTNSSGMLQLRQLVIP